MFVNQCASARSSSRDACIPTAPMQVDVDLKQQLIYMQMTIKEIGANVNGLERKMDATCHGITAVELSLLQLKEQHQSGLERKIDATSHGISTIEQELLCLLREQQDLGAAQREREKLNPRKTSDTSPNGVLLSSMQNDKLQKIEQGVNDLLAKGLTEGKAGAPGVHSHLRNEFREELGHLQISITNEMKMLQESFLQNFQKGTSRSLPPPPSQVDSSQAYQLSMPTQVQAVQRSRQEMMNLENAKAAGVIVSVDAYAQLDPGVSQSAADTNIMPFGAASDAASAPHVSKGKAGRTSGRRRRSQRNSEQIEKDEEQHVGEDDDDYVKTIKLAEDGSLASVFGNDDDPCNPAYNVENFYYKTGLCQKIARGKLFENFTVGVVVFNAVYIGFDSDYNDQQNIYEAAIPFQACSQFFCVYFTWELLVRLFAFEHKRDCMKDGWFKFDAFLVSTMIIDTWMLMPVLAVIGGGVKIPTQPLRMLRLFKLTRMARLMQAFPELVTMIKGLVRSLRAISSSMILIGLMVYVWAIMMHMLLKEEDEFNQKLWRENLLGFATMTQCIWTLLMDGTLMLDNSAPLMTSLLFSDKMNFILAGAAFMTYALLSAMLILQMLIGVLCDVVSRVGSEQRDAIAIGLVKQELLHEMRKFDSGNGKITQPQLLEVMNDPNSKTVMKSLNINRLFLMQLQKMMFPRPGSSVTIKSVLELMVMCRGDNPTTVESLAGGLLAINQEIFEMKNMISSELHSMQEQLEDDLALLEGDLEDDLANGEEEDVTTC